MGFNSEKSPASARKLDGTMSPFEHGEVFVLDDGGEADLDLGNYERFNGITLTRAPTPRNSARNSLTACAIL